MSIVAGIEYTDHGSKVNEAISRTPIVCLHGIGGDHNSFEPQWQTLSDTHRVLAWNMPGYRGSTPLEQLNFETLSDRFIQWIDALNIGMVHIVGQSIGGMLAQTIAFRYPDRVQSLVLIATTAAFGGRDDSFKKKFLDARMAPLDNGEIMADLANRFVPEIVGSAAPSVAVNAAIKSMAAVPEATYRRIMECLVTFDGRAQWLELDCPICLIAGSQDTNAPARAMEKMALTLNGSRAREPHRCEYHCVEGAGHLVNLEQADTCNNIIRQFLLNPQN